jgi:putative ABC transport system permease protein
MFAYYLDLALRSLKRTPVLAGLMVLAIGLGIGASMTMLTVLHVMTGDPLPGRSGKLYAPVIDPRPLSRGNSSQAVAEDVPDGFTLPDATNLLRARRADRQAAMSAGQVVVHPLAADPRPFFERGEFTTADFFAMFDVPFRVGAGWTAAQDAAHARVVVLNGELARKLFGDASAIGRTVRLQDADFRVIGVLDDWHPQPAFYQQASGRIFGGADQVFLPLQTALDLKFRFTGHLSCWGSGGDDRRSDRCTWLQFWAQLDTRADAGAYSAFLADYWRDQQAHGRMPRAEHAQLFGLMDWLAHEKVIPGDVRMQLWLALGFLFVCMVNITALLLAKFLRRSGEISVRRAMGARRRDIFIQLGIESMLIGVSGGALGLLIAQAGLWSVRQRPEGYAQLARMDPSMLIGTLALAILASLLAGLLPAWRACHVPPALQLKAT